MQEPIDLVIGQKPQGGRFSLAVAASLIFHAALIVLFLSTYTPQMPQRAEVPIARYVELIKQNPREFVEAPGRPVERAPLNAPLSDANRRAATPKPTGDQPTPRPADRSGLFTPPTGGSTPQNSPAKEDAQQNQGQPASPVDASPALGSSRIPALRAEAAAGAVNWRSVIRDVKQIASIGGDQGLDLGRLGGEKGTAETGPLSFETQWYDWGEYAQSMVSKIRVHWYEHMPMLIRTGMRGVVTIRFTIQRDGKITDIVLVKSSGVPPYDFAARKAIELASPLNPLPKDFPLPTERVTAMFYYNQDPPQR